MARSQSNRERAIWPTFLILVSTRYGDRRSGDLTMSGLGHHLGSASSLDCVKDHARLLRAVAAQVKEARLSNGARVLDAGDFRVWLIELAEKAERSENVEQFLSQI